MPTPEARIGPIVDPHPISFLTTNSYTNVIKVRNYCSLSCEKLKSIKIRNNEGTQYTSFKMLQIN